MIVFIEEQLEVSIGPHPLLRMLISNKILQSLIVIYVNSSRKDSDYLLN